MSDLPGNIPPPYVLFPDSDMDTLVELHGCENKRRHLQDQVSVRQCDVTRWEDNLQKHCNVANRSAEALKESLAEKDVLREKMLRLDDKFRKLGITHDVADRKIDILDRQQADVESDIQKLMIRIKIRKAELVRCSETNRILLELLSKARVDQGLERLSLS